MTLRILSVVGCIVLAVLSAGALGAWFALNPGQESLLLLWSLLYSEWVLLLIAVAGASLVRSASRREVLGLRRGRFDIHAALAAPIGALALSQALEFLFIALDLRHTGALKLLDEVIRTGLANTPWLVVLSIGIAPGICEELLFRGYAQRTLHRRYNARLALVASAVLFGLAHFDPVHSPFAFVLGLYLGVVALLFRSIWMPIACHMLNNLTSVVAIAFGYEFASSNIAPLPATLLSVACFILALACLAFVTRRLRHTNGDPPPASATPSNITPPPPLD